MVRVLPVSALLALTLACATGYTGVVRPVVDMLEHERPEAAMERLREVFPDTAGNDRLLYLMELGNLARYAGNLPVSRAALLRAEALSDQQRGVRMGQEAASMLTGELAREFRGADYEKVFINYALAAVYASEGNLEEALVEARRVNQKLREFNDEYGENPNRYIDDAFVRYFMGVLYEAGGEPSDALISYRMALRLYEGDYSGNYGVPPPERLGADLLRLASETGFQSLQSELELRWPDTDWENTGPGRGFGEIVVVLEAGSISGRYEKNHTITTKDRVFRVCLPAIPEFPRRPVAASAFAAGNRTGFFLVQDMNALARANLEDHAARDLARAAARVLVKAGVSQLGEELAERAGDDSRVGDTVGLILSIVGAVSDRADLRAWLTIPAQIHMARLRVPPGTWPLTVTVNGVTTDHAPVEVRDGETAFVFARRPL